LNSRAMIFLIIIIICIASMGAAILRWMEFPAQRSTIIITGVWCGYNMLLALATLGAFWERRQIRSTYRINVREPVHLFIPHLKLETEGQTSDISLNGMSLSLRLPHPPQVKDHLDITVPLPDGGEYVLSAQIQRVRIDGDSYFCGVKFLLDQESFAKIVSYVYGNSARWLAIWNKKALHPGTLWMLYKLLILGFKGLVVSSNLLLQVFVSIYRQAYKLMNTTWKSRLEVIR